MLDASRLDHLEDEIRAALGEPAAASLYLDRCQVDTPDSLVKKVWSLIHQRRPKVASVVDFGAGDARFARAGRFERYTGYEIDRARYARITLPPHAEMINACAFSAPVKLASVSTGNPPFVRNQDLPLGWRQQAARVIEQRTGVRISGLANAWQYFFLLSLASTRADGLVALVIPYEWVSRPSSAALREYIRSAGWDVAVYRLSDETFDDVLTTSSITMVDKRGEGKWKYFRETDSGQFIAMASTSGERTVLAYKRATGDIVAKRGLSPGTQEWLTLTEGERTANALSKARDVVPCVTSLRCTSGTALSFTEARFEADYVNADAKCWLIRTDKEPSVALQRYLDSVPEEGRQTRTCQSREHWWAFTMPSVPAALIASGFRERPKVVLNQVGAIAVGSVCGIYAPTRVAAEQVVRRLREFDYSDRVVAHAHGLRKLEINQINALIGELDGDA